MRTATRRPATLAALLGPLLTGLLLSAGPAAAQAGSDRAARRGAGAGGDGLVVAALFPGHDFGSLDLTERQDRRLRALTADFLGIFGDDLRRARGRSGRGRIRRRHLGLPTAIRAYRRAVLGVLDPGQLRALEGRRWADGRLGRRLRLDRPGLGPVGRRSGLRRGGRRGLRRDRGLVRGAPYPGMRRGLHWHGRHLRFRRPSARLDLLLETAALRLLLGEYGLVPGGDGPFLGDHGRHPHRLRRSLPGFGRGRHPHRGRRDGGGHRRHSDHRGRGHRH